MQSSLSSKTGVADYMDERLVKYKFRDQEQNFLPKSVLSIVTQQDVIQRVIEQEKEVMNNHDQKKFVDRVCNDGRKLFAICVFGGLSMNYLKIMLENGLTDANLPLSKKEFGSLKAQRDFVFNFTNAQGHFNTVSFSEGSFQDLGDSMSSCFSIPIHFEDVNTSFIGKGAFGEVWKVQIHSDHRSFLCEPNDKDIFAMKVTQHEGREKDYHRAMEGLYHSHLVKCLTDFTLSKKYHMIYELADCNLEELMRDNPNAGDCGLTGSWLAHQLAGLAGAVKVIHNPEILSNNTDSLRVPLNGLKKSGYIHDIKPENILVFNYTDSQNWLRISDFSCAKVVEFVATVSGKRDSYKTHTRSGTPIYRPPESSSGGASSRPYDMWSLGCVYSELLVWFIDGYKGLKLFRDSRETQVCSDGIFDEAFYYKTEEGTTKLREPVVEKLKYLSQKCDGGLKDILDTIPLLLKIDPKERLDAAQLVLKLKHLGNSVDAGTRESCAGTLPSPKFRSPNLPAYDSDSDSDFGCLVKVEGPGSV